MRSKRGGIGDLLGLFVATIVIAIILIGFVVIVGVVKTFDKVKTGEKIYREGDVGVGDVKVYMKNYGRLVKAEGLIEKGEFVDEALELVEYGQPEYIPAVLPSSGRMAIWGVFYG